MKLLHRAVLQAGSDAPSVPNMFPSLAMQQVSIRRGEVSMIAGQPASGKSTLALAIALRSKVSTLYFSADSHQHTQAMRTIAMLTDCDQSVVEQAMEDRHWAAEMLGQANFIRWNFDSSPSIQTIERELEAHVELTSRAPELCIVDNLTDVLVDGDEWGGMRNFLKDLKFMAREYDTAMLVLHHATESIFVPQGTCPPRSSLQGKVAATPALVLTVAADESGFLGVAPVKNRYGPSNPSGSNPTWFRYDPARMLVSEVDGTLNG